MDEDWGKDQKAEDGHEVHQEEYMSKNDAVKLGRVLRSHDEGKIESSYADIDTLLVFVRKLIFSTSAWVLYKP